MLVCHSCLWITALYAFPAYLPEPLCPLCDGTRCPWCYYPRTLPDRARGRFPPIMISNDQPETQRKGGKERPRRRGEVDSIWASPFASFTLTGPALCDRLMMSVGFVLWWFLSAVEAMYKQEICWKWLAPQAKQTWQVWKCASNLNH